MDIKTSYTANNVRMTTSTAATENLNRASTATTAISTFQENPAEVWQRVRTTTNRTLGTAAALTTDVPVQPVLDNTTYTASSIADVVNEAFDTILTQAKAPIWPQKELRCPIGVD
jgi:hypothetical protein